MNIREKFINYVKNGGSEPFVSLQIGAGAGFDVKLAGKVWNSEGTLEDTIRAYEIVECDALYNIGLPDFQKAVPALRRKVETEDRGSERVTESVLETPYGPLKWKWHELPKIGTVPLKYPVTVDTMDTAFDQIKWFADQHVKGSPYIAELLSPSLEKLQPHGPVSVQWNVQPFEMFGLASVDNLVLLAKIEPEQFRAACDHIRDANIELLREVFKAGADFIFLGGPGSEMLSPQMYEDYLIPDSQKITDVVHEVGGLIYSHICSPIEPFLTMGFYNRMGIDLFETLSPPPVGNVQDLARAREIMEDHVCTRGNIGLDVLLNGSVREVEETTHAVLEATHGSKHMVAASDYLFYDIPLDNVKAMVKTVHAYKP